MLCGAEAPGRSNSRRSGAWLDDRVSFGRGKVGVMCTRFARRAVRQSRARGDDRQAGFSRTSPKAPASNTGEAQHPCAIGCGGALGSPGARRRGVCRIVVDGRSLHAVPNGRRSRERYGLPLVGGRAVPRSRARRAMAVSSRPCRCREDRATPSRTVSSVLIGWVDSMAFASLRGVSM